MIHSAPEGRSPGGNADRHQDEFFDGLLTFNSPLLKDGLKRIVTES